MRQTKTTPAFLVGVLLAFSSACVLSQAPVISAAASPASPADNSLQLLVELQSVREELSSLRGTIEELQYRIARLEKNQKQNYANLDGRVSALYSGKLASSALTSTTSTADADPVVPVSSSSSTNAAISSQLYREGFDALRQGDRDKAIASLQTLVNNHPNAAEVADARYWLGETYWLANQKEKSRQVFVQLLENTPDYRKAGDAMYRLGIIYDQLGDFNRAFDYMNQVVSSGSNQATAAQAWLEQNQLAKSSSETPEVKQPNSETSPINE